MRPFTAAFVAAVFIPAVVALAEPAADARIEYSKHLCSMADTAAGHVALAKWCEANGLPDRAQTHWGEALYRDPGNAEAKVALGLVKPTTPDPPNGPESVLKSAAGPAPSGGRPAASADPTFNERRRTLAREIQDIFIRMLGSGDPQVWDKGQRQVLMIRDPAAAEPIARILSMGNEKTRQLACDVLAQIPGEEASKFLARFALTDESEAVRQAAVKALRDRNDRGALGMFTNALNGSPQALDRAAYALGEIGDLSTAPALIGHLKTPETKVIKAPAAASGSGTGSSGAYITIGTIVTYIADAEPVVAQGAVGWDLQIGAIPVGTTLSVQNPRVTIYRTIIQFVPRPAVRAALRKMTGKDCEYNPAAWRDAVAGKP